MCARASTDGARARASAASVRAVRRCARVVECRDVARVWDVLTSDGVAHRSSTRRRARVVVAMARCGASASLASSASASGRRAVSLVDVHARARGALRRGHRLIEKRRELRAGMERARDGGDDAQARVIARDIERVDASVERIILRVEALKEIARALEAEQQPSQ